MIKFKTKTRSITLIYQSDRDTNYWAINKLATGGKVTFNRTYNFTVKDLIKGNSEIPEINPDKPLEFRFATRYGEYFKIKKNIITNNINIYIHNEIKLNTKDFVAIKNISIFRRIERILNKDIYIGGNHDGSINDSNFQKLIKNSPNTYEVEKYVNARLGAVLKNYFETPKDPELVYNNYMNKKISIHGANLLKQFKEFELEKFKSLLLKLNSMLENQQLYVENVWQSEISEMILLLNPKYIQKFTESPVFDHSQSKKRRVDFLLVDASGCIDIVEIKRPEDKAIITERLYRDNHLPLQDLTGTVMQIEKYIYHLNRSGINGEKKLTEKYKTELPKDLKIKITNPRGIIIMGRDNKLSPRQKEDFEIIKRKYNNIIDIVTYDELIRRLKFTIKQLETN